MLGELCDLSVLQSPYCSEGTVVVPISCVVTRINEITMQSPHYGPKFTIVLKMLLNKRRRRINPIVENSGKRQAPIHLLSTSELTLFFKPSAL